MVVIIKKSIDSVAAIERSISAWCLRQWSPIEDSDLRKWEWIAVLFFFGVVGAVVVRYWPAFAEYVHSSDDGCHLTNFDRNVQCYFIKINRVFIISVLHLVAGLLGLWCCYSCIRRDKQFSRRELVAVLMFVFFVSMFYMYLGSIFNDSLPVLLERGAFGVFALGLAIRFLWLAGSKWPGAMLVGLLTMVLQIAFVIFVVWLSVSFWEGMRARRGT